MYRVQLSASTEALRGSMRKGLAKVSTDCFRMIRSAPVHVRSPGIVRNVVSALPGIVRNPA